MIDPAPPVQEPAEQCRREIHLLGQAIENVWDGNGTPGQMGEQARRIQLRKQAMERRLALPRGDRRRSRRSGSLTQPRGNHGKQSGDKDPTGSNLEFVTGHDRGPTTPKERRRMITVTSDDTKPYTLIGHADGLPYGFPADTVAVDDWAVSSISGAGADGRGYESLVRRIIDRDSDKTEPHPDLYGRFFPSVEAANLAYYEAGVTAYFIQLGSPEYAKAMEIIGRSDPDR